MHIADIKVPQTWTKLEDLLQVGRTKYEIKLDESYYIHNNSHYILYITEAASVPAEDEIGTRIYAGKSAGYVKTNGDLYVCSKLPDVYPYPDEIGITFCNDVVADNAIPVGAYTPAKDVKGAYVYKGSVATKAELPTSDVNIGDVYNIEADGMNVAWTGTEWDDLGATINVDLTPYAKQADVDAALELKASKEEVTEQLATKAEAEDVTALETKLEDVYTKEEIEAKGYLTEHQDISGKADQTTVDAALELKADKTELDAYAKTEYVDNAIAGIDHSTYATKEEVELKANKTDVDEALALKADAATVTEQLALKAAQTDVDTALEAKANASEVTAALALKADQTAVDEALEAKAAITYVDEQVATKQDAGDYALNSDVELKADETQVSEVSAAVTSVLSRMDVLEDRLSNINKTNVEAVASESGTALTLSDSTKDYVVAGSIDTTSSITGKSATLNAVTLNNNARLDVYASGDVDVKGSTISGNFPKASGNAVLRIREADYVTIKDTVVDATLYNAIEIGLGTSENVPKGVLIDNCKFMGTFSNNAILIFGTQDNAVININNCSFESVSNVLRLSNRLNKSCTVNITNCSAQKLDSNPDWTGLIICQDYTSGTADAANENNLFAPNKVVINISNFTMPDGSILKAPEDISTICGTRDANQIIYVWDNYRDYVEYGDGSMYPTLNIA